MAIDPVNAARCRRYRRRKKGLDEPYRRPGRPRSGSFPALDEVPVDHLVMRALERVDQLLPSEDWLTRRGIDINRPDPDQLQRYRVDAELWELACALAEVAEGVERRNRAEGRRDWTEYAAADPRASAWH